MNCLQCTDNLTAYLDKELLPSARSEVESHLASCARCGDELHTLKEAMLFLESHSKPLAPGPAVWSNIRAQIAVLPAPSGAFWLHSPLQRWALPAAALAVSLVLGLGIREYLQRQQSERALQEYMSQYVRKRESQELAHRVQTAHREFSDNPFVAPSEETSFGNPFREQGQ
jgi:anti-sigma factor RsiW